MLCLLQIPENRDRFTLRCITFSCWQPCCATTSHTTAVCGFDPPRSSSGFYYVYAIRSWGDRNYLTDVNSHNVTQGQLQELFARNANQIKEWTVLCIRGNVSNLISPNFEKVKYKLRVCTKFYVSIWSLYSDRINLPLFSTVHPSYSQMEGRWKIKVN